MALTSKLAAIADAIRTKTGMAGLMTLDEMAAAISNITTGGDEEAYNEGYAAGRNVGYGEGRDAAKHIEALIIERAPVDVVNEFATKVGAYAFYENTAITSIDAKNALSVGDYAFAGCDNLESANIPAATIIEDYAFDGCENLKAVDISRVKTIYTYAFQSCGALEEVHAPLCETVSGHAFRGCSSLAEAYFPLATSIGASAFRASGLREIILPAVNNLGSSDAFRGCTDLTRVDLGAVTSIPAYTFNGCSSLNTVIIRTPGRVCSIASSTTLTGTPIAAGTGHIFVPDELVDAYASATNWMSYASQIKGLSELEV